MVSSNPLLRQACVMLERAAKEQKAPVWQRASELLAGPGKNQVEVNLSRLSRIAGDGQVTIVPGKVLGTGLLEKKLVVGAFSFSTSARSKIVAAGGAAMTLDELLKKYPKGSGVKLVR